jgi:hypothetical protein
MRYISYSINLKNEFAYNKHLRRKRERIILVYLNNKLIININSYVKKKTQLVCNPQQLWEQHQHPLHEIVTIKARFTLSLNNLRVFIQQLIRTSYINIFAFDTWLTTRFLLHIHVFYSHWLLGKYLQFIN